MLIVAPHQDVLLALLGNTEEGKKLAASLALPDLPRTKKVYALRSNIGNFREGT